MLRMSFKGLNMPADNRNAKVVASLIVAMTIGAVLLLSMEPPRRGWAANTMLIAEHERAVEALQIEYVAHDAAWDPPVYDCIVFADGRCFWQPRGPRVRLAVVGSDAAQLPAAQAEALLAVLGSMSQRHGLDLSRISLDAGSDVRLRADLPPQAGDLRALLVRKGVIR